MKVENNTSTLTDYNANASHYDQFRRPSPIIRGILEKKFASASRPILSLGCGTGRMEEALSASIPVVGLDRSAGMLDQAKNRAVNLVQADMTHLPFAASSFGGAYFMQSFHHVGANLTLSPEARTLARKQALAEAIRAVRKGPIIIIQRDPSQNRAVWFWHYFPSALKTKLVIQPEVSWVVEWLAGAGLANIEAKPVDDPMARGFYDPQSPLNPSYRRSFSDFSYLSESEVRKGIEKLKMAISDGSAKKVIQRCKQEFKALGGTVFVIFAEKI